MIFKMDFKIFLDEKFKSKEGQKLQNFFTVKLINNKQAPFSSQLANGPNKLE